MASEGTRDFFRVIVAFFIPPVGVFLQVGLGAAFWINLLLTVLLFWLPGAIHAAWVITTTGPGGHETPGGSTSFLGLLAAMFLPPVGVAMKKGIGLALLINIVLSLFFVVPGTIHAVWVITSDD